jgi:D-lactate dehydrogenase (cytochrome)
VPLSKLAQCIEETIEDLAASPLIAPVFGHVGDGNFHCVILANPDDPAEVEEAERLNKGIMRRALAFEGTCTGEHGIGRHKIGLLREELGDDAVSLMQQLKHAWDPDNIMNPGKVVMQGH